LIVTVPTVTSAESHFCRSAIEATISEAARAEGVSPALLAGLCYKESAFHPLRVHHNDGSSDSIGLCQIKFAMAQGLGYSGTAKGLLQPNVNARYAAKALRYHQKRTHGNEEMLAAYNAGRVNRKGGVIRNIRYVRDVQKNAIHFLNLEET
jgi:soluble lytic murein transglycosylase-like protein